MRCTPGLAHVFTWSSPCLQLVGMLGNEAFRLWFLVLRTSEWDVRLASLHPMHFTTVIAIASAGTVRRSNLKEVTSIKIHMKTAI